MEITLELNEKEAEGFLVARTKDLNVVKYSTEAKTEAVKVALYDCFYEVLGNFEMQREIELKKIQLQKWLQTKQAEYNKGSKEDDTNVND